MRRILQLLMLAGLAAATPLHATTPGPVVPTATVDTAVFAGGCFWGIEGVFEHLKGVTSAVSGYAGGTTANPTYEEVSTGETGHAESVQVVYDPSRITYAQLLQVFFSVAHDPTLLNRQGPDHGTQYRSAIFYRTAAQQQAAQGYIAQLTRAKTFDSPIVTQVTPLQKFYPAEGYHQDFMEKNPNYGYIVVNDAPKVEHLRQAFPTWYRSR